MGELYQSGQGRHQGKDQMEEWWKFAKDGHLGKPLMVEL